MIERCGRKSLHPGIWLAVLLGSASMALLESRVAPASPLPQSETPQIRARVELVSVDVSVTDARGRFVGHLKRENFRVFDEGVEQPLTHFAPVESPARLLILVEAGPAVYLLQREHRTAALKLLEDLAPDDWVGVAAYGETPRLLLPLTQNKPDAAQALAGMSFGVGRTRLNLHASVSTALDWLAAVPGKKAIVLLGTGLDSGMPGSRKRLLEKLQTSEAMLYAVGLGGSLRKFDAKKSGEFWPEGMSFQAADRALTEIAAASGGRAFFPMSPNELTAIYRQVASALRHQYSLGFTPAARDGRFRRIEVQVVDRSGRVRAPAIGRSAWRVRARPGYVAPEPE